MTGVRTDRAIALSVAIVALVILSLGGWVMYLQWSGNFHVVEPGLVYRSNTLGSQQLETVIATYGIKTIVNLRGRSPKEQWYREEVRRAQLSGVTLVDIPMSDSVEPDSGTLDTLLTALKSANRPILIHCKAGADRTGLASALFELFFAGEPAAAASHQLSMAYGHFPWWPSRTGVMDEAFWSIVANREEYQNFAD